MLKIGDIVREIRSGKKMIVSAIYDLKNEDKDIDTIGYYTVDLEYEDFTSAVWSGITNENCVVVGTDVELGLRNLIKLLERDIEQTKLMHRCGEVSDSNLDSLMFNNFKFFVSGIDKKI